MPNGLFRCRYVRRAGLGEQFRQSRLERLDLEALLNQTGARNRQLRLLRQCAGVLALLIPD
jgi:hypothetical protein